MEKQLFLNQKVTEKLLPEIERRFIEHTKEHYDVPESKSAEVKDGYLIIDGYVFAFRGEKTIVWKSQRRKLKLASNCKINYSGGEMFYPINSSEVKKGFKVRLEIVFDVDKKGYVTAIAVCS